MADLRVEGLSKTFLPRDRGAEALPVLDRVEIEAPEGRFVSIVGPSGCGKSTLFNLIAGLDPLTAGRIEIGGRPPPAGPGTVGYMPQQDLLMPWRTVLDNAGLGLEMRGISRREARAAVRERLAVFGLEGFERAWPAQLSAGMRQRAALLRTFLAGGELLLLDEPFGALDALTRRAMQEWLLGIWERERKTVVLVTHDVEEALLLSDRVYALSERPGRVIARTEISEPRPRDLDRFSVSAGFVAMKAELLARLHSGRAAPEPAA